MTAILKAMGEDGKVKTVPESSLTDADKWVIAECNDLVKEVTENLEKYELGVAAQKIYDFIWEELCDWYIEMVKPRLYGDDTESKKAAIVTLKNVLKDALKLLHPYMPFVTEEIYCTLCEADGETDENNSIMISAWPLYSEAKAYAKEKEAISLVKEAVKAIRNLRTGMNVPPSRKAKVYVVSGEEHVRDIFAGSRVFFATLGYASEVAIQADKAGIEDDAVSAVIHNATLYIPFAELVDIDKEIERLTKEKERLEGEIRRSNGMLSNEKFISKAPEAKVNEEKEKLAKYESMLSGVNERLAHLKKA